MNLGMLPEGERDGAGVASPTEPVSPPYANRGWAGPGFTVRNDESAPPTLDPADLTAITQGDDEPP